MKKVSIQDLTPMQRWRDAAGRPGFLMSGAVLAVLLGFAASVDFPRAAHGFKGDEATYYSLTYSIARDFDMTFQRHDLVRVWDDFPGPEGIFLKRGSRIDFQQTSTFPFVRMVQTEDPARFRLFYGKSYIYPLFAAPFVRIFGTNGFLIFHALLLALCFGAAYRFLTAVGSGPALAGSFAAVFIFATVVPVYFVWLAPELFNFAVVLYAYFLWAYKLVAPPAERAGRFERFLRSPASDYSAAALLGIATFSKPTNVPLILPLLALTLLRHDFRRGLGTAVCFGAVVAGLFAINAAATGEFNYQGGLRKSFYSRTGFPFANTWETFDNRGQELATDAVPLDILFHRDTAIVFLWNLGYFVVGRYSGLLPYFFPGVVAGALFLASRRDRQAWQWLVAAALAAGAVGLICYMPYTFSGGGGPIGNRYFLSFYPLFLFLMPPLRGFRPVLAALAVGALFTAKLVLNPFYTSSNPGEHANAGPLRLLPIERTLLNDLAVSANSERSRRPLAGTPPVSAYFVDDGAFPPEGEVFWVKGRARADVLLRAPTWLSSDQHAVPLRVRAWSIEVTNGNAANKVSIGAGRGAAFELAPGEVRTVELPAGAGVPYKPARFPTNYVYIVSIRTSAGFVPFLEDSKNSDSRYLGAMIRIVPVYFNP